MADQPTSTDTLIHFLDTWKLRRVVVVGDFMLDRHVLGNADRLSPDAPVPVLTVDSIQNFPGGASNVCLDLRALGCEVACLGVVGREHPQSLFGRSGREDSAGQLLRKALGDAGCDMSGLILSPDRVTTVKFNLVGLAQHRHPQKMFRVDAESKAPVPADVEKRLLREAKRLLKGADALCIEDYNKGVLTPRVCQELIALAKKAGVPVLVDPAAVDDYRKYRGATVITPNRTEAAVATGTPFAKTSDPRTLDAMARQLQHDLRLDAVVLTLDKQGILLLAPGMDKPQLLPTQAREVYDVTGAGDMVLAMLAAAAANGADWTTATKLANVAAGLEVEKFGVVPIRLDEILVKLLQERTQQQGKLRTLQTLLPELAAFRAQGRKIAFVHGRFDQIQAADVTFLRRARETADMLIVGLSEELSPDPRVTVLSELQSVDYIVAFNQRTPVQLIKAIKPDTTLPNA